MRVFYFSENPYPLAWDADPESIRVTLPNRNFDPVEGSKLLNRYLDEWVMCDELGLDIWVNEHRSTATCLSVSSTLPLAILARETKRARLLTLGVSLGARRDPISAAEEISYIDVVSQGRLELGLVKGYSTEFAPANINPAKADERFWEAHDLLLKAITTHDGPFNWEGEHFHFRQVNIWPRPYQQPHPPIWMSAFTPLMAPAVAERGHVIAGGINPRVNCEIFSAYRHRVAELGRPAPELNRFANMGLVAVGETEEEGHRFAAQVKGYLETTGKTFSHFLSPPGYIPVEAKLRQIRAAQSASPGFAAVDSKGQSIRYDTASVDTLIEAGAIMAGTPDQVFNQIKALYELTGGFDSLLAMMQGGVLSHADTVKSATLFSREVLPRLQELKPVRTCADDKRDKLREITG